MPMAPSTRETTEGTDRVMNPSRVSKCDAEFQAGQPLKAARIESAGPAAYRAMREWSGGVPLGGWPKENLRPAQISAQNQDIRYMSVSDSRLYICSCMPDQERLSTNVSVNRD